MQLEIATGFYQSDSKPLAAQRCVNWMPVIPQASTLNQRALFDVYGIAQKSLTGDAIIGQNRGGWVVNGVPYFVCGQSLYSISATDVVTDHGSIPGISRVSMADNGRYLVIVVPGDKAFAFDNTTSTLTEITDGDFVTADTVSFKDGYFIFTNTDGEKFFVSNLNQPLVYDALDFGSADVRPDKIVATHVNQNELFVFGEETIELFQNIGGSGFPFQRVPGGNLQKGLHAKHSVIDFDNSFVFIGGAPNELSAIWKFSGGLQKISTSAIDNAIQEFTEDEISDAFAMTYSFGGNFLVSFTFTSTRIPSKTFVYDATTSALAGESTWHERQSGVVDDKWRVTSIVSAYGKLLVGDSIDGRIGEMSKTVHDEYSAPIYRRKASMPFISDNLPVFAGELQLTMESGVGTIAGLDPQVQMRFSDNGARTWSNGFWRSYGKIGNYDRLPTWRRQGRIPRHRVLEFVTSAAVKSNVLRLDASAEQGSQI